MYHDRNHRADGVRWSLPTGFYNPVVTSDGRRWRDFELVADAEPSPQVGGVVDDGSSDWFDRRDRPPRLPTCRPYGVPGGLTRPDPHTERDLVKAVPVDERGRARRFPDPRGTWIRLINGEGAVDDPFRATNAVDCALSVLSTWHGEPEVAAPRLPEYDRVGRPLLTGEAGGVVRAERWTGHRFEYAGHGRRAYASIARRLTDAGHGAAVLLVTRWPSGGSHAWNAVNTQGEVVWIDGQRGHMAVEPPYESVTGVFCVLLDRGGRFR
ncbi:toxin glutamine deamidase domain-containing protein [Sinosporangium siamense]|uniref:toxin glutamine deamidase domain-containing protein n=1 Tax=Sinosporangium siamense TaxID=1367973 RepID=UPI001950D934|nr:toxin glutamine deamidase domain-containing protein [Sinosporangium siamense]